MKTCSQMVLVWPLVCLLVPSATAAQASKKLKPTCLEAAALKIHPGQWIRVTTTDTFATTGRLDSVQPSQSLLSVHVTQDNEVVNRTFAAQDISKIQYRKSGKIRPGYMLLGLVAGGLIGGAIGEANESNGPEWRGMATAFGIVLGAGGGLVIGTVLPVATPSTRTIRCP